MKLLTLKEAAAIVGVHQRTFEKEVLPTIPTVRIGRKLKVLDEALDAWIRENSSLREKT
jgi:excisionase family DNA binding protein